MPPLAALLSSVEVFFFGEQGIDVIEAEIAGAWEFSPDVDGSCGMRGIRKFFALISSYSRVFKNQDEAGAPRHSLMS